MFEEACRNIAGALAIAALVFTSGTGECRAEEESTDPGAPIADALLAAPTEINNSLVVTKVINGANISWTDAPGPYNVYRGTVAAGAPWAYNQSCLATSTTATTVSDNTTPPVGGLSYYLVSRLSGCEESVLGRNSSLSPTPASGLCFSPGTGLLPAKAYFMVAFDTSGSMTAAIAASNSCAYPNNRLGHGRCALKNMLQAFSGQANFGLATYAMRMSGCAGACYGGCAYAGFPGETSPGCGPEPNPADPNSATRQGSNIVVPMQQDNFWDPLPSPSNAATMLSWADNVCPGNAEVFANGGTPINGVLRDIYRYLSTSWTSPLGSPTYTSPISAVPGQERSCRSVNVILITDGDESCDTQANAVNAAQALLTGFTRGSITWSIKTYVINFIGGSQALTDQIAAAGGTTASYLASNETQLSQALATIIGGAGVRETCDNADNNCNGCVDEGYRHFRDEQVSAGLCCTWGTLVQRSICLANYKNSITPGNPQGNRALLPCTTASQQNDPARWLCYDPGENCDSIDNNGDNGVDEGLRCGVPSHCPTTEVCNGIDDDCDAAVDEGGVCPGGCTVRPEVCNGCDDDCDGLTDDGISPVPCGQSTPANCQGIQTCMPSQPVSPGGCAVGGWNACANSPAAETCDGLDNNCNGAIDDSVSCPCSSRQELCNGIDDNCNSLIDEGLTVPSPVQVCGVSPIATRPECTSGVGVSCVSGSWVCAFPAGVCTTGCAATSETCDGLDNNCDGRLNENVPKYGTACNSDDGLAPPGHGRCRTSGSFVCAGPSATTCSAVAASCATLPGGCAEACDGIDNDCDGLTDEPYTNKGTNTAYFVKPAVTEVSDSLWEFSYEASRPSADASFPGYGNGYFTAAPAGTPLDKTPACSVAGRVPWFTVTPQEAEQTCQAMGGVLCSQSAWQIGCQATASCTWGYAPRGLSCLGVYSGVKYCNLAPSYDFNPSVVGDQDGLLKTASSSLQNCNADWSATIGNSPPTDHLFDVTGNLREFTRIGVNQYGVQGGAFNTALDSGATCTFNYYQVDQTFSGFDAGFRCCFEGSDPRQ